MIMNIAALVVKSRLRKISEHFIMIYLEVHAVFVYVRNNFSRISLLDEFWRQ